MAETHEVSELFERALTEMQAAEPVLAEFMRQLLGTAQGFDEAVAYFFGRYGLRGALRAINHYLEGGAYDVPLEVMHAIIRLAHKTDLPEP